MRSNSSPVTFEPGDFMMRLMHVMSSYEARGLLPGLPGYREVQINSDPSRPKHLARHIESSPGVIRSSYPATAAVHVLTQGCSCRRTDFERRGTSSSLILDELVLLSFARTKIFTIVKR